jgi:hypothetical protein
LAFATVEERVMVTFDTDFLALHQTGIEHAGIAWCQEQKYTIGKLIQALLLVHGVLDRMHERWAAIPDFQRTRGVFTTCF